MTEPTIEQVLLACRSTFESNGLPHDLRVRLGLNAEALNKLIAKAKANEKVVEVSKKLVRCAHGLLTAKGGRGCDPCWRELQLAILQLAIKEVR